MPDSLHRPESSSGPDVDRQTPSDGTDQPLPLTGSFHPTPNETPHRLSPTLLSDAESRPGEAEDLAGTKMGAYELLEVLGRGGMGIVYKVRHATVGHIVALKTIRNDVTPHPTQTQRFLREVKAAAQLTHPNIVPIYEVGEHGARPYYTMPLVAGGNLAQHRDRFEDERAAAGLIEKVARGIECAHERNILHRDLKPANILLDEHGEPLVSDFGLAKLSDAGVELTQTGMALGTPAYMAPEQAAGKPQAAGPPTDVWALGVILYELVAKKRPFVGDDSEQVKRQILHFDPPTLRESRPGANRRLESIVRKCLEKDPARRYSSAGVLASDLASWSVGGPILPKPETRLQQAWRTVRRRPRVSLAIAFLAFFTVIALGLIWWTDPERPRKEIERKLARGEPVVLIGNTGMPRWFNWLDRKGVVDARAERGEGPFAFHSSGYCFLELMRDPQQPCFSFSAEVWHRERGQGGRVGLFSHYDRAGTDHFFCSLDFNDFGQGLEQSQAQLTACLRRLGPQVARETVLPWGLKGATFRPADGLENWRRLKMEVYPEKIRAWWGGVLIGEVSHPAIYQELDSRQREFPDLNFAAARFSARDSLGIYLSETEAAFRNVMVEPLAQ